jgi:hypothetical protein
MLRRVFFSIALCVQLLAPAARTMAASPVAAPHRLQERICASTGAPERPSPETPCAPCDCLSCVAFCVWSPAILIGGGRTIAFGRPAARVDADVRLIRLARGARLDPHRARAPPA